MILCSGEALIDMMPVTAVEGGMAFAPLPGGAAMNTARALGRLGVRTGLWCGLSDDMFGTILREELAASGVDISLCPIVSRPTTLAFVSISGGQTRYTFLDENSAARMVEPRDIPRIGDDVSTLLLGGISLVPEPCGSAHEALCMREAGRRLIMLDLNIRPAFVRDPAAYRARLTRMIAKADIVKVSDEDIAWLYGPGDPVTLTRALLDAGPRLALLTRGAAGAVAVLPGGALAVEAPEVTVVDTVGAGDAFDAGFLAALGDFKALRRPGAGGFDPGLVETALRYGVRVASLAVMKRGAAAPLRAEVEARDSA